jgi:hypothetical protein
LTNLRRAAGCGAGLNAGDASDEQQILSTRGERGKPDWGSSWPIASEKFEDPALGLYKDLAEQDCQSQPINMSFIICMSAEPIDSRLLTMVY